MVWKVTWPEASEIWPPRRKIMSLFGVLRIGAPPAWVGPPGPPGPPGGGAPGGGPQPGGGPPGPGGGLLEAERCSVIEPVDGEGAPPLVAAALRVGHLLVWPADDGTIAGPAEARAPVAS